MTSAETRRAMPLDCDWTWAGNGRAWLPKIPSPARSGHGLQTVLLCEQVSTRRRRFTTTALLGFAPARSTRASAANHRESISDCPRDNLGVANSKVTSKSDGSRLSAAFLRPARAPAESRNHSVSSFAIGADRSDRPFRGPRAPGPRRAPPIGPE
jgi:hypothetical protein